MKVYHRRHPDFLAENKPIWPSDQYELVAEVICDSLDRAYELTNHIDTNWAENPGVTAFGTHRSTSVGDVIVDNKGKPWWCKSAGWEELPCKEW